MSLTSVDPGAAPPPAHHSHYTDLNTRYDEARYGPACMEDFYPKAHGVVRAYFQPGDVKVIRILTSTIYMSSTTFRWWLTLLQKALVPSMILCQKSLTILTLMLTTTR